MNPNLLLLALLVAAAIAPAAWAGDIIVVEPEPAPIALENDELTQEHRGIFSRMIALGCTRKAKKQDEFINLSNKTGNDSAALYCNCMAPKIANEITLEAVKVMFKTRQMSPEMQASLKPKAQACMREAGYRPM